jgi:hypothetical protein
MPRTTNIQITSAFDQVQTQARQLLVKLRQRDSLKRGRPATAKGRGIQAGCLDRPARH